MMGNTPGRGIAWLAAGVTIAIWSSFIVVARASQAGQLAPLDIALLRILGASALLLPWSLWRQHRDRQLGLPPMGSLWGLSPLPWRPTLLAGLFGGLLYSTFAYVGFFYAPASHASVLMPGTLPLWSALLSMWLLRERLGWGRSAGLGLIVGGVLLVGGGGVLAGLRGGGDLWKGHLFFLAAASCWGTYAVLARRFQLDAVRATAAITLFALVALGPLYGLLALLIPGFSRLGQAGLGEIAFQMGFQGGLSVVVSGVSFTVMIQRFGPVRTTMLTALVPGLSALGAVVWLGEPMQAHLLLGLALVTLGIVVGVRFAGPQKSSVSVAANARQSGFRA